MDWSSMKRRVWTLGSFLFFLCSFQVWAAESKKSGDGEAWEGLAILGDSVALIILLFVALFIIGLLFEAIFIWLASKILNFRGTFGTAFKASFLCWIFQIFFGLVAFAVSAFVSQSVGTLIGLIAWLLAGTYAINGAYHEGFFKSMVAYVLSVILTIIILVGLFFALVAALGIGASSLNS